MTVTQRTLTGSENDTERERPSTFLYCPTHDEWILRSRRHDYPHELYESPDDVHGEDYDGFSSPVSNRKGDEEDDEEAKEVGGVFNIRLSYSVDYNITVAAWNEKQAEERAKDIHWDQPAADAMHVHTDKREVKTLYEDSAGVPEDYDHFGSTPLWEVYRDE